MSALGKCACLSIKFALQPGGPDSPPLLAYSYSSRHCNSKCAGGSPAAHRMHIVPYPLAGNHHVHTHWFTPLLTTQGRPKGENKEEDKKKFSLAPVAVRLQERLGKKVRLCKKEEPATVMLCHGSWHRASRALGASSPRFVHQLVALRLQCYGKQHPSSKRNRVASHTHFSLCLVNATSSLHNGRWCSWRTALASPSTRLSPPWPTARCVHDPCP
eukprot:1147969-Pelagomonas_calceolata.AAC.3